MEQGELQYRFHFEAEEKWRECLKENGFVVIANWIPRPVCEEYVNKFWDIIEFLSEGKVDRHNPETQVLSKNYPPVLHGGMIQYVGHSQPQWDLRKALKPLFAKLWGTEELSCSFDGFCFMNGKRNYQKVPWDSFLHTDQSPRRQNIWSVQGVLTLTNSGDNEGGFVCVPGSNKKHKKYFTDKNLLENRSDWFLVPQEDKDQQVLGECIKVNSEAGDFILFDSKTFHANTVPVTPILRVCTYICMIPKDRVPEKRHHDRRKAVQERRVSSHHPGEGFRLFPTLPRFVTDRDHFGELVKEVNDFKTDPIIESLI